MNGLHLRFSTKTQCPWNIWKWFIMKISHCFIFLNLINIISSFLFNKTNENEGNIEITAYLKTLGKTNIEIIQNQFYFLDGINNSHAVVLRNEKSKSTLEHFLSDSQLFSIEYLDIKNQPLKGMKNQRFKHKILTSQQSVTQSSRPGSWSSWMNLMMLLRFWELWTAASQSGLTRLVVDSGTKIFQ